jgi:hypothetical protein
MIDAAKVEMCKSQGKIAGREGRNSDVRQWEKRTVDALLYCAISGLQQSRGLFVDSCQVPRI